MKNTVRLFAFTMTLAACVDAANAQQPKKLARVCYLGNTVTATAEMIKPFQQRLREIGYVKIYGIQQ